MCSFPVSFDTSQSSGILCSGLNISRGATNCVVVTGLRDGRRMPVDSENKKFDFSGTPSYFLSGLTNYWSNELIELL